VARGCIDVRTIRTRKVSDQFPNTDPRCSHIIRLGDKQQENRSRAAHVDVHGLSSNNLSPSSAKTIAMYATRSAISAYIIYWAFSTSFNFLRYLDLHRPSFHFRCNQVEQCSFLSWNNIVTIQQVTPAINQPHVFILPPANQIVEVSKFRV
jgi:hypothetical protein